MNKLTILILSLLVSTNVFAQLHTIQGMVMDGKAKPLQFATVSLLKPEDSTLAFFSISNTQGVYEIKNVSSGKYILQAALLGRRTFYKQVQIPLQNKDEVALLILDQLNEQQMKEVEIRGERIAMQINNDTITYNAGAFKTKPDASVEELLKKLPGVEVDPRG